MKSKRSLASLLLHVFANMLCFSRSIGSTFTCRVVIFQRRQTRQRRRDRGAMAPGRGRDGGGEVRARSEARGREQMALREKQMIKRDE